jgi:hypothetical protein
MAALRNFNEQRPPGTHSAVRSAVGLGKLKENIYELRNYRLRQHRPSPG